MELLIENEVDITKPVTLAIDYVVNGILLVFWDEALVDTFDVFADDILDIFADDNARITLVSSTMSTK